jgi:hypothetical protein
MRKLLVILAGLSLITVGLFGPASAQTSIDNRVESDMNGFAEWNATTSSFGAGDLNGDGLARILLDANNGRVCFQLRWSDIDQPAAGHIHVGGVGVNGPVVVDLLGNATRIQHGADGTGGAVGCASGVSHELIEDIGTNPGNYYTNLHNAAFPGGAIRGNLEDDEEGI